jgi:hypothetical protein
VRGGIFAIDLFALHQGMDAAGARLAERASRTVVTGLMSDERRRACKKLMCVKRNERKKENNNET